MRELLTDAGEVVVDETRGVADSQPAQGESPMQVSDGLARAWVANDILEGQAMLPLGRRVPRGKLRWYLAHCPEGAEDATCAKVRQIVDRELLEDAFVPRVERVKKVRGVWITTTRVLFPGYFVVTSRDALGLSQALARLSFRVGLVGSVGRSFCPVDEDASAFLAACMDATHTIRASEGEIVRDELHVLAGPLVGSEARVRRINRRKALAMVGVGGSDAGSAEGGFGLLMPLAIPVRR